MNLLCRLLIIGLAGFLPVTACAQTALSVLSEMTIEKFAPYIYLLLAFLAGGVVISYLLNRRAMNAKKPDQHVAAILSSAGSAFYYRNLDTQYEWFSRKLRDLLNLSINTRFETLLTRINLEDQLILSEHIEAMENGEAQQFLIEVSSLDGKSYYECNGVLIEAESSRNLVLWWQDVTKKHYETHRLKHENERVKLELRQLSNMFNALPIPVWQRDKDLTIRYCNLAYLEAAEEMPDSATGEESLEIHGKARELAAKALKTGNMIEDRRHIILNGARKLYDFIEVPWEDRQNLTGIALDKSEIEKLSEKLADTLETQGDLLESITSAIAIYGPDQRLKYHNNAYTQLWKLDEVWLSQKPNFGELLEKLRDNRMLPEQSNFPAFKQKNLKIFTDLLEPQEEFFYLPDGRTLRRLAIPDSSGGVLFADEDVTDRLALERSYNTLIAVQRETLDHLYEGVAVFGQDGRLKLYNPVYLEMWKLDQETAKNGPHLRDILARNKSLYYYDDWEKFSKRYLEMMASQKPRQMKLERTDGRLFDVSTVPLPDGQKLFTYVDLTDSIMVERSLREKNEALEEADRLKSEFLANVSYELRSPLTSIRGFYEMLNLDYVGSLTDKQSEYLENIGSASDHLMNLINDILDVASIEAGYLKLDIVNFDLLLMLSTVQSMMRDQAEEAGVIIDFDCDIEIGSIDGDQNRLRQVVFNLMSNAIKYSDEGGVITLHAHHMDDENVEISVTDQGDGIPELEQDAVFNKFYRSSVATRKRSGTGLGLSMVKSFIELHGGEVILDSNLGEGTTVRCIIPRTQPEAASSILVQSSLDDKPEKPTIN